MALIGMPCGTIWPSGEPAVLDAGSWITATDGYEPFGDGSLRRQAKDAGGIEGQAALAWPR